MRRARHCCSVWPVTSRSRFFTILPAAVVGRLVQHALHAHFHLGAILGVLVGVGAGLVGYLVIQALLSAPELPPKLRLESRRSPAIEGAT